MVRTLFYWKSIAFVHCVGRCSANTQYSMIDPPPPHPISRSASENILGMHRINTPLLNNNQVSQKADAMKRCREEDYRGDED